MSTPRDHLAKADDVLRQGYAVLDVGLPEIAARHAYLAAFHAAAAIVLSRTGKVPKTHHGLHSEFARLTRTELDGLGAHMPFLSASYDLKQTSDYLIGAERPPPSIEQARRALRMAGDMLAAVTTSLNAQD